LYWAIIHLLMNCYAASLLGPLLERPLGSVRFVSLYWLAGLAGTAARVVFYPGPSSGGASRAVVGPFGGLSFGRWRGAFPVPPALNQVMTSILVLSLVLAILPGARIAAGGHFGGLAGGFLAGFVVGLPGSREWPWAGGGRDAILALVCLGALLGFAWLSAAPY